MDKEFQLQQIEKLQDMFATEGWKIFFEDMQNNLNNVISIKGITGSQQLGHRQGQVQILEGILNYERIMEAAEQQLKQEPVEDDEETV